MVNRVSKYSDRHILKQIRVETFTSGAPGGQHANRTASAVRVVHIPTGISAIAREHRSQLRNRRLALERLFAKLRTRHRPARPRLPTTPPPHARYLRRRAKEHRSRLKQLRRKPEILEDSRD